ncbi:MAG: hypothetical protein ACYSR8_12270 [Planctomycetota bacterium]|jgi:hypothetical protein
MKKKVSIYIDGGVWENLREHAWARKVSASVYLEGLLSGEIPFKEHIEDLENLVFFGKKYSMLAGGVKDMVEVVNKKKSEIIGKTDAEIAAEEQKKLDAIRKRKGIKQKDFGLKEMFRGGYSKDIQLGKK